MICGLGSVSNVENSEKAEKINPVLRFEQQTQLTEQVKNYKLIENKNKTALVNDTDENYFLDFLRSVH